LWLVYFTASLALFVLVATLAAYVHLYPFAAFGIAFAHVRAAYFVTKYAVNYRGVALIAFHVLFPFVGF
jgi:hypothetical protein